MKWILALVLALVPVVAQAQTVPVCSPANPCTIEWNPNPEPDILEYRVLVSRVSGQYDLTQPARIIPHPNVSGDTAGIGALEDGTHYVAVVAVDRSGNVSGLSNEAAFLFDGPPGAPVIRIIQVTIP